MIALELVSILLETQVSGVLSWPGRISQYLGVIYLVPALFSLRYRDFSLEEALTNFFQAAETRYRDLIETSTDAIISADQRARILLWNQAAKKIFGYRKDEVVGKSILGTLFPSQDTAHIDEDLREIIQKKRCDGYP